MTAIRWLPVVGRALAPLIRAGALGKPRDSTAPASPRGNRGMMMSVTRATLFRRKRAPGVVPHRAYLVAGDGARIWVVHPAAPPAR